MPIPSIYINLEDDVSKIAERLKKEKSAELILVCPKRCFLFNDSINLRLLKKQTDLLGKKVSILTMDEKGQLYAREAGFELKHLPKSTPGRGFSDIAQRPAAALAPQQEETKTVISKTVEGLKELAQNFSLGDKPPAGEKPVSPAIPPKPAAPMAEILMPVSDIKPKSESIFPRELESSYRQNRKKSRLKKLAVFFIVFAFLLAAAAVFAVLPSAQITVYPKTQNLTRDLEISASVLTAAPDPANLSLPLVRVSQQADVAQKFQSQGKKEVGNKASGTVRIYNFTGSPLNLRAKTTTLSLNNKNYLLDSDVLNLKPTRYKNPKTKEIDETSLAAPIDVTAQEGGEGYNLPAGTRLEITNQVFGSKPQLLYAKASDAITGGTTRYLSLVSQSDVDQAKEALSDAAFKQVLEALKQKSLTMQKEALNLVNPEISFDQQPGAQAPEFSGSLKAQANGLAYDPKQLEDLVLARVKQSLLASEPVSIKLAQALSISIKSVDQNDGSMILDVHFEGRALAQNPDLQQIKSQLTGKSQPFAADLIKNKASVDKVEITIVPGWQKWLPFFASKINIQNQE